MKNNARPQYQKWKKGITWSTLFVQVFLPCSSAFIPLARAAAPVNNTTQHLLGQSSSDQIWTIYTLGAGETTASVAKKFGLTIERLREMNMLRVFPRGFDNLTAGDELNVPSVAVTQPSSLIANNTQPTQEASWARQAGQFLSNNPDGDAAAGMARGMLSSKANDEITQWLQHFGTARIQLNTDEDFTLKNSAIDLLLPLWDTPENLLFSQGSYHRTDDRSQSNIGAGLRHFTSSWMVGSNIFFDYDYTREHSRGGVGVEYWRDFFKLNANSYFRMSGWRDSPDIDDYQERPANGWDIRMEGYLPAYPQLGAKAAYEQYYGDKVGLFGHDEDDLQKDPYGITFGMTYTPVPLVTFSAEQKQGKGGKNDSRLGLDFSYQLGVPFSSQLEGSQVATLRSLAGSRYDLVDRNNNIVLEYRKKETITLKTAAQISGFPQDKKSLAVSVNAKYGVDHIQWQADSLLAHGGQIVSDGGSQYSVILPDWQSDNAGVNTYTVRGVAYDHKGNASAPAETQVIVKQSSVSVANSTFTPASFTLLNDGAATQALELTLRDAANQPVTGVAASITLDSQHAAANSSSGKKTARAQADKQLTTSAFTETEPGKYRTIATAGTQIETVTLTPHVQGVTLGASQASVGGTPQISNLTITGTLEVGQTLQGRYSFDAHGSEGTDKSTYVWGYQGTTSSSVAGGSAVSTSGSVADRPLTADDAGHVMELSVMAKNGDGITGNSLTVDSAMSSAQGNETTGGQAGKVIYPGIAPAVSNLKMSGALESGQTLSATYQFTANGGAIGDKSRYAWGYQGETAATVGNGQSVATSGQVPQRALTSDDIGKVMEISVQALNDQAVAGNTITVDSTLSSGQGNATTSGDSGKVINPGATPSVSDLKVSGTLEVGQQLSGSYVYTANNGDDTDKSQYAWGHQGQTAAQVNSGAAVTTSGSVPSYTLVTDDAGQVMELSVQAKNGLNGTGNVLTADSTMSADNGNNTDGGNSGKVIDPAAIPSITDVTISGKRLNGETLTATYTFHDNNGEPTDKSTYAWGYQDESAAAVGSNTIATSGVIAARLLTDDDVGKVMELSVQPKNNAATPVTGDIVTVNTVAGSDGNSTTGPTPGTVEGDPLQVDSYTINGHDFSYPTEKITMVFDGAPLQLNAPANSTAPYTWSSSDSSIASVDSTSGLVTWHTKGSVTFTLTDGFGISGTVDLAPDVLILKTADANGNSSFSRDDSESFCNGLGYSLISGGVATSGRNVRKIGSLWGEWGNLVTLGWTGGSLWTRDEGGYDYGYHVHLNDGSKVQTPKSQLNGAACVIP